MRILLSAVCGFCIDLLLGDPPGLPWPHPVVVMGRCITALEKRLRAAFPKTARGERAAGMVLAVSLPLGTLLVAGSALWLLGRVHPLARFLAETVLCWQALAVRDLHKESMNVYHTLRTAPLKKARVAVARIVGRDTQELSAEGVIKAAVETVAENFSDGVVAPMFYMLLGGAPLALCYKAVNTMDSMVGYKNARYIHFGRAAAKLDDGANYLPARIAALLLIASALAGGADAQNALRIWRRDRRKHASPNSAQCEAVMAGALGVALAGPAYYFGTLYEKPVIGDSTRPVVPEDIPRANRLMILGSFFSLVLFCGIRALALCFFG